MRLYAIADLHLSIGGDKPMDMFGSSWVNHTEKLKAGFAELKEDDVCVICGDLSWGMGIDACLDDFRFIDSLPGKKIILKGNHDYWWTTRSKTESFFKANGINTIEVLNNNSFTFGEYAICGTRGWFYEEETGGEHDRKIMNREVQRLNMSLESAGDRKKLVFLHYPPMFGNYRCDEILNLLKANEVRLCCYGHIHSKSIPYAFNGWANGTEFRLVSADAVNFAPVQII